MIYLAKSSREGRLLRSCKNCHKSSAEMLKTSYRHSLSSLAGFLMVLYWFSKNKQRKKQKCTASELKLETTYIAVQWEKCFFSFGMLLVFHSSQDLYNVSTSWRTRLCEVRITIVEMETERGINCHSARVYSLLCNYS